ncbi:hypothetical protein [Halalkalibacter oceani]|uniref:hypothetical protein n=1 Tax=Halalkalibacter oceani TaxID=1653776 RepID=UPI00339922FF
MIKLIQLELRKLRFSIWVGVWIAVLFSCLAIPPVVNGYTYHYNIEVWEQSGEIFNVFFPLFAVIPGCWLMYVERKHGFLSHTLTRVSRKTYITVKWLVVSLIGALIVFLVSFTGLVVCLYVMPDVSAPAYEAVIHQFAGYYFIHHPFLYGFVLSLWKAFIGFLIASFGFVLSLYINNLFIILTGPFVYTILENFTLAIFGLPYFRLVTSFEPSILSDEVVTFDRLLVGPALLLLFILGLIAYFTYVKKESIYQV